MVHRFKLYWYAIAAFITFPALLTTSVAIATPTQYGDSGLISVPTSEVIERGKFDTAVWLNHSRNDGKNFTLIPLSLTMGFGGLELSGSYPNILTNNQNDGSMRGFNNIGVKYSLVEYPDSNLKAALSVFFRQSVSEKEGLGGLMDLGSRLILSYQLTNIEMHFNVGYLKVDSPSGYNYDNRILFGGAIESSISERFRIFMEFDGNTNEVDVNTNKDGNRIELMPGMQYYIFPNISIMSGAGMGITDIGPGYRALVGLIFSSGAGRYVKAIPVIPGSRERYAQTSVTAEELMPELPIVAAKEDITKIGTQEIEKMEALEVPPMPVAVSTALEKPGVKEVVALDTLIGEEGAMSVPIEPPMPVSKATAPEKAPTLENVPLEPEVPAEVAFTPPLPVAAKEEPAQQLDKARIGEIEVIPDVSPRISEGQPVVGKRAIFYEVWFFPEKTTPSPYVQGILDKLSDQVKKTGESMIIKIEAHTDRGEKATSHTKLSSDRANGVKDYLVKKHGFDPNAVVIKGYGNERPTTTKKTPEERRKNRRAEIIAYSIVEGTEAAKVSSSYAGVPASIEAPPASPRPQTLTPKDAEPGSIETASLKPGVPAEALPIASAQPSPVAGVAATGIPTQITKGQPKAGKKIFYREILFLAEKPDPSPFVISILDKMAEEIKKNGKSFVARVDGHADSKEGVSSLTELSSNRANSVKDYLVKKHGFDPNAFIIKGYGNERPVASSDTPEGMKKNRRVEITVFEAKD